MMNSVTSINKLDFSHNQNSKGGKSATYDQTSDDSDQDEESMPLDNSEDCKPPSELDPKSATCNQSVQPDLEPTDFDLGAACGDMTEAGVKLPTDESKF